MLYQINGENIPPFSDYKMNTERQYSDVITDETGREHRTLIRASKYVIEIEFGEITYGQLQWLRNKLNPLGFQYIGNTQDGQKTFTALGELSPAVLVDYYGDGPDDSYWSCTLTITEV